MDNVKKLVTQELSFALAIPAFLWQLIFLCVPLSIIIYFSVAPGAFLSLSSYVALIHFSYVRVIARSLLLATATALITLMLSYPIVYYIVRHLSYIRKHLLVLLMLPFLTNFLVLAYSWFFLLERDGLINSFLMRFSFINEPLSLIYNNGAVLIVMCYCYLPFMIMPLYVSLEKLDVRLLEASADLGANAWQTFVRVTLPLSFPGIKTGLLLVFVPAFGEFAIPTLLGGSKFLVVGSLISYYFFVARNNSLGAAFTIVAGIVLFLFLIALQKGVTCFTSVMKKRE